MQDLVLEIFMVFADFKNLFTSKRSILGPYTYMYVNWSWNEVNLKNRQETSNRVEMLIGRICRDSKAKFSSSLHSCLQPPTHQLSTPGLDAVSPISILVGASSP